MPADQPGPFGPVVVRRRLGATLRRLRENANLRLEEVARELEISPSKISRLETGHSVPKTWDVRNLLTVYRLTDSDRSAEILRWVDESKAVAWWHPFSERSPTDLDYYMSLESEASSVSQYCTPVLPGLIQTPAYAAAYMREILSDVEDLGPAELDGLIDIRLRRQEALYRAIDPLAYDAVIDEAALLRHVGSEDIMREQLLRVIEILESSRGDDSSRRSPGKVEFRVRPFDAPSVRFAISPFTIFVPRLTSVDLTIVNVEAAGRDFYVEEAAEVVNFQNAFKRLWSDSLDAANSIELVRRLI